MTKNKHGDHRSRDPNFKSPVYNRSCTDVFCCVLFILALLGYVAVGILAWSHGDVQKMIHPTDSTGQICGQDGTSRKNKSLLFFFNIIKCASPRVLLDFQCPTTQICVEKCPERFLTLAEAKKSAGDWQYYTQFCKEGENLQLQLPELLTKDLCPEMIVPSRLFMDRCLPIPKMKNETGFALGNNVKLNATDLVEASKNIIAQAHQVAMGIFQDYMKSWHWILLGLVIAMVLSLFFIILLRLLAGVMVWATIIMVILVIGYGIFHCYMQYAALKGQAGANVTIKDLGLLMDFSIYLQIQQTWKIFMIILGIVELVILLVLIFLRKRILIAIGLIKEASRAMVYMMSSLFYPLVTFALVSVVIVYWIFTAVLLSTSSRAIYKVTSAYDCKYSGQTCKLERFNSSNISMQCPGAQCLFAFYGGETYYHKYLLVFQFYNLFLFFWSVNFVTALGQVTLAGAFASYYWAFKKPDDIPAFPIFSSLGRALRYHTGSLAFGSLVLSIIQVIRMILEYLERKLKVAQNGVAKFILRCLKCCFWCMEKFIRFLNRNAYIMIAIYGKNFCTSAKKAFSLLLRNIIRVVVLDKVTDFLLFLGKLLVVGIVGICSFFFFTGKIKTVEGVAPSLNYYWVPIATLVIGSYLIAHGFFSVYAMCVDTLFLCFLEDLERNDGSAERPYFMSKNLLSMLKKRNKKAQPTD